MQPGPAGRGSGGAAHSGPASAQRGAKRQPGGHSPGGGTRPGIVRNSRPPAAPRRGTAASSARV
jgi:hypothetical protein